MAASLSSPSAPMTRTRNKIAPDALHSPHAVPPEDPIATSIANEASTSYASTAPPYTDPASSKYPPGHPALQHAHFETHGRQLYQQDNPKQKWRNVSTFYASTVPHRRRHRKRKRSDNRASGVSTSSSAGNKAPPATLQTRTAVSLLCLAQSTPPRRVADNSGHSLPASGSSQITGHNRRYSTRSSTALTERKHVGKYEKTSPALTGSKTELRTMDVPERRSLRRCVKKPWELRMSEGCVPRWRTFA
jgi:hypothetical protein